VDARTSIRSRLPWFDSEAKDLRTMRALVLVTALTAAALAGCSSSGSTAKPGSTSSTSAASTTTGSLPALPTTAPGDPDQIPNPIPFDVGEIAARSNGWRMGVTRVVRPFTGADLPPLPANEQYVAVDIMLSYDGTAPVTVNARKVFGVTDQEGHGHVAVSGARGVTGLDGSYTAGTTRTGRMIFAVPIGEQLLMLLDGPAIHTQRTIFQVDPPNHPAQD